MATAVNVTAHARIVEIILPSCKIAVNEGFSSLLLAEFALALCDAPHIGGRMSNIPPARRCLASGQPIALTDDFAPTSGEAAGLSCLSSLGRIGAVLQSRGQ
jgi:hypothetical protein